MFVCFGIHVVTCFGIYNVLSLGYSYIVLLCDVSFLEAISNFVIVFHAWILSCCIVAELFSQNHGYLRLNNDLRGQYNGFHWLITESQGWRLDFEMQLKILFPCSTHLVFSNMCCFGCTCNTIGGTEMSCWYIEGWAVECLVLVSWSLSFHSLLVMGCCLGAY
jgi:hypothetical protein